MAANAAELLWEIRRLLELKGENPFKVRAYERAVDAISGREDLLERAREGTLTEIEGIGKGISEVLTEYLLRGSSSLRDELAASLPPGLVELTEIPGLGPKKAMTLIESLKIQSVSELEYACRENRLLKLPGFGPKMQQKVLEGVLFRNANQNRRKLGDAFPVAEALLAALVEAAGPARVSETGALRRRLETLGELEFLVEDTAPAARLEAAVSSFREKFAGVLPVRLYRASPARFGFELARTSASPDHWKAIGAPEPFDALGEEDFYSRLDLPWIPPEMRETGDEVVLARAGKIAGVLPWEGIRGAFHAHTTRSDGSGSLEEMVLAARKLGYGYLGISDHSQSAFYAQGLKPDALDEQEREVRKLQEKYPDFRIFWGIESDILADGSLDYEAAILKRFDFVIASIHSRFQMDRETMTNRILEAIRNPYTRFVGHLTGRLLLGRPGYELDVEKVIREAAKHDVAIEINSHPARLDIDWRWGGELRREGTRVSINPDAHEPAGLADTRYGIAMARKALLPKDRVVNSMEAEEAGEWLRRGK